MSDVPAAGDDKTIVQPTGQAPLDTTSPTLASPGNGTGLTASGAAGAPAAPSGPVAPPSIPDVELQAEIGRGGMGVVWKGRQPYLDRLVAVKLLLVEKGAGGAEYVRRFQREAKILAGLSHPHIVGCYQAGLTADGNPYLVMEFIDGPNLRDWVKEKGALPPAQAVRLVRDLSHALEHANVNGIIHRDVKPENVLLARNDRAGAGEAQWTAKLVDLGLARPQARGGGAQGPDAEGMHLTMQGMLMGTPTTMAPEQFNDPDHVDFRADIYGLGCVLYQSLTGAPAFTSRTLGEIVSAKISGQVPDPKKLSADLPKGVCDLVTWMLAADRKDRPQSYAALIERCEELTRDPTAARRGGGGSMALAGGVLVAALAAAGLGYALTRPGPAPAAPPQVAAPATAAPVVAVAGGTPAAETPMELGEPQPLFGTTQTDVLAGWTVRPGAQWAASEEVEQAVSGSKGLMTRPVAAERWELACELQLNDGIGIGVGVVVGTNALVLVSIKNLGGSVQLAVDQGTLDAPIGGLLSNTQLVAQERYPVRLRIEGRTLSGDVGGVALKPVALPGTPTALALYARSGGDRPPVVLHPVLRPAR